MQNPDEYSVDEGAGDDDQDDGVRWCSCQVNCINWPKVNIQYLVLLGEQDLRLDTWITST